MLIGRLMWVYCQEYQTAVDQFCHFVSTRSLRSSSAPLLHVPIQTNFFSANALSALQHNLSGTLSLSPSRTVTRLHYLNLDLKHICSPPFMLLNCPVRQRLWSHGNMALYKFCIALFCIVLMTDRLTQSVTDQLLIMYGILLRQLFFVVAVVYSGLFLYGRWKQLFVSELNNAYFSRNLF